LTLNKSAQLASASNQHANIATSGVLPTTRVWKAWFKTTTTGVVQGIVSRRDGLSNRREELSVVETGKVEYRVFYDTSSSTAVQSPASVADGNPHLVVGKLVGTALTLYVDGAVVATATMGGTPVTTAASFLEVGRRGTGSYFNGTLDEVAYFESDLSDAQVENLWLEGTVVSGGETLEVVVAGAKKSVVNTKVIVGGAKKSVVNRWVIVGGVKKPLV
jgi:hypothetical protein